MSSSIEESNDLFQSDPSNIERIGEVATNVQTSEAGSDASAVDESILSNNSNPNVPCTPPSLAPGVTPSSIDTTLPDTFQKKEETQRVTTTDIQPNSVQHPSEWSTEVVLRLFQTHKLDNLYKFLSALNGAINGETLANMYGLKQKNYDYYRAQYTSHFRADETDLLKDFDRFSQLLDKYFRTDKYTHRFDVALSFPGDIRDKVEKIVEKLADKINPAGGRKRIFYDNDHKAELARPNLDLYLQEIYRYQTRLIVVFMCEDYARKEWCGLESRAIRDLLKTRQNDRIMLLTVDGKRIDGIFSIDGHMDISKDSEDEVASAIYSRLMELGEPQPQSQLKLHSSLPPPLPRESMISKMIVASKNAFHSISPWYIVVVLLAYILGTIFGY